MFAQLHIACCNCMFMCIESEKNLRISKNSVKVSVTAFIFNHGFYLFFLF